ncbi:MAG: RNA polymerase sigma factor, partial [Verrucomicrobiales bacterium]|nr:RNA polymerase sigma factor [Verrucomicrobiales bacterium]
FARQLSHDDDESRDLVQDLFVKIARQPALLQGLRNERAFLLCLLRNGFLDLLRRRQTRGLGVEHAPEDTVPIFETASEPDEEAFRAALAAALVTLPLEQREVVHLKLWEGLTFEAIAELLDLPLNTAASRYRYGVDKLRHRLRPLYEELQ